MVAQFPWCRAANIKVVGLNPRHGSHIMVDAKREENACVKLGMRVQKN